MFLRDYEQTKLMKRFPSIELSYEKHSHKKVHNSDIYYAIPFGKKYFAWFTYYRSNNVCVIIELSKNLGIASMRIVPCCFHSDLSYGTLLFGTVVNQNQHDFFAVEDIYCYKGDNLQNQTWEQRIPALRRFFEQDTKTVSFNKNCIVFSNVPFNKDYNKLITMTENLSYPIYCIQSRSFGNSEYTNFVHKRVREDVTAIFNIEADKQNDIYNLYCYTPQEKNAFYNIALIPSYKSSVMMNGIFRIIKENNNLDKLEESDDEDEFENIDDDKFVDLRKRVMMRCKFSHRFKKWIPIEVTRGERTTPFKDIKALEKKN